MPGPLYDSIGGGYSSSRAADPRLAAALHVALGDAASVLNVGAGTGAYEPSNREVVAVEPSAVMIAQRPPNAAPVIQAAAEALPLPDDDVDAAMAVISDHHWTDRPQGLLEMARVARRRVVLLTFDPAPADRFWLTRDYLPGFLGLVPDVYRRPGYFEEELCDLLGAVRVTAVPIPHDCRDGFYYAFWRRPRAYLDSEVRDNISVFRLLPPAEVSTCIENLAADLRSRRWENRYAELSGLAELEVGLRLVVADVG